MLRVQSASNFPPPVLGPLRDYATAMVQSERYPAPAVILHWAVAVLVFALVALGWWMQEIPKQPPGPRADAFNLHKSLGLVSLALVLAFIAWRATHSPPRLPPMPRWQARVAIA